MPMKKQLSDDERKIMAIMLERGYEIPEIADTVGRCKGTIYYVRREPGKQGASPRSGRPSKLTPAARRAMMRCARRQNMTAREIK